MIEAGVRVYLSITANSRIFFTTLSILNWIFHAANAILQA